MLSVHPNIVFTRRTYMWTRFYNRYGDLGRPDNFECCLTAMLNHKHMGVLEPDPDRIRREFWQGPPTYARLFALFHEHYAERVGKARWGDQLGFVEQYADPIFAAYPEAKMVHMIRDPRTRYQSSKPLSRQRKGKVGWDTARWLYSVSLAKRNQKLYSDRYKVVRYESLEAQPEQTLREVCAFIGEDFVPAMITMEDTIRFKGKNGQETENRSEVDPITKAIKGNSYGAISKYEIAFTQSYAEKNMLAFDYPLQSVDFSLGERLRFYFIDWPVNAVGMVAWRALRSRQFTEN